MRTRILVAVLLVGASVSQGCNRDTGGASAAKPTVALVVKTLNNAFFIDMEKGAQAAADSLGIELIVQAPEREIDAEKQMQIAENLIERHVGALAIAPNGSKEIVPAIVKANAAGIPVITVDARIDTAMLRAAGGRIDTFIGSDNVHGGQLAGEFIAQKLGGKGKVAILETVPGHETGDSRLKGFRDAVAKFPGVSIVASQTANGERDQAFNVTQNILQAHGDIQAIFACNDVMALGAIEAVAAARKTGSISIVGFDAQDDARKAIKEGRMSATIAQNPREMGRMAVLSAYKLFQKEPIPMEQPVKIELVH